MSPCDCCGYRGFSVYWKNDDGTPKAYVCRNCGNIVPADSHTRKDIAEGLIRGDIRLNLSPGWFQRTVDEALSKPSPCECKKALMTLNDEIIEKYREQEGQEDADA